MAGAKQSFIQYLNNPDEDAAPLAAGLKEAIGIGAEFDADVQLVVDTAAMFGDVAGAVSATEDLRDQAQASAISADVDANAAAADRLLAATSATASLTARLLSEAAASAAQLSANVYATEALGRAAVADNVTFSVQGAGDVSVSVYRRINSGSSTFLLSFPSLQRIESFAPANAFMDTARLFTFIDGANKIVGAVGLDAKWDILLGIVRANGFTMESLEINDVAVNVPTLMIVDASNKILFSASATNVAAEVIAARGTQASLDARLDVSHSEAGTLKLPKLFKEFMRQCHQRITSLRLGGATQLNIGLFGDSFTQLAIRYARPVATLLIAAYGDGGGGWTGYGYASAYSGPYVIGVTQPGLVNGNARSAYALRYKGTWASVYNNSPSPDLSHIVSSTAGDSIQRDLPATPLHTALRLIWLGTADGVVRWRIGAGGWTTQNVQGGVDTIQSADLAVGAGAQTIEIEVVSGTVKLCGDNALSSASGVRLHKLGGSGSRITQWAGQNATQQQASWTKLALNAATVMDGTNSQGNGDDPLSVWKPALSTVVTRLRAALAFPDICIIMPPENQRLTNPIPMADYVVQGRELARELNLAFRDAQPDFGILPNDYRFDSAYPLFNADLTHPEPGTGGDQLAAVVLDMIIP